MPCPPDEPHLSPEARRREIAAILARGVLRLRHFAPNDVPECCIPCNSAMVHTHTVKRGGRRYRYYVCANAQRRGWSACPSKSVPAQEMEDFVVDQVRGVCLDPKLLTKTLGQVRAQAAQRIQELNDEKQLLDRDLRDIPTELPRLAADLATGGVATDRAADLQDRARSAELRTRQIVEEIEKLQRGLPDHSAVAQALAKFDPVWQLLAPREQARLLRLLVQRVDYNGAKSTVSVTLHPAGLQAFAGNFQKAVS